jgi:hypothetical protein
MRSSRVLAVFMLLSLIAACAGDNGGEVSTTESPVPATVDDADATTTSATAPSEETTTPPSGGGGDLPDPCSLLTLDDVMTATGVTFDEGMFNEELSGESQVVCDWIGTEEFAFVQVLIVGFNAFDSNRASAEVIIGVTDVEIPGVSAAYATTEGSVIGMSMDSRYLQVSYIPSGPGTVLEQTTQLATIAAANLG